MIISHLIFLNDCRTREALDRKPRKVDGTDRLDELSCCMIITSLCCDGFGVLSARLILGPYPRRKKPSGNHLPCRHLLFQPLRARRRAMVSTTRPPTRTRHTGRSLWVNRYCLVRRCNLHPHAPQNFGVLRLPKRSVTRLYSL